MIHQNTSSATWCCTILFSHRCTSETYGRRVCKVVDSFPLKCPMCASSYASSSAKPSNSLSKTLITAPMSNRPNLQTCGWCPLQACVLQIAMHCVTKLSSASMCVTHCNALCPQIVFCKHVQRQAAQFHPTPHCHPSQCAPQCRPNLLKVHLCQIHFYSTEVRKVI